VIAWFGMLHGTNSTGYAMIFVQAFNMRQHSSRTSLSLMKKRCSALSNTMPHVLGCHLGCFDAIIASACAFYCRKRRNVRRGNTVYSICNWLNLIEIRPSANFATRGNTIGSVPPAL
jgi:hypothetical protein